MLEGASFWILLLELPARSVVFTWIFRATGGSALLAVLLHATASASIVTAAVASVRDGRVAAVILVLEWLVAAALALPGSRRSRSAHRRGEDIHPDIHPVVPTHRVRSSHDHD